MGVEQEQGAVPAMPIHASSREACGLLPTQSQLCVTLQFSGFLAFTKDCARLRAP